MLFFAVSRVKLRSYEGSFLLSLAYMNIKMFKMNLHQFLSVLNSVEFGGVQWTQPESTMLVEGK